MGSFSLWHWLVVLLVVVLLFGTKKLRNVGGDLGAAIRSFKKGLAENEAEDKAGETSKLDSPAKQDAPSGSAQKSRQD